MRPESQVAQAERNAREDYNERIVLGFVCPMKHTCRYGLKKNRQFGFFVSCFTLIEVITVVVIIGILAALAVPNYLLTVEIARNRDAIGAIRILQQAENQYRLESPSHQYVACADAAACNAALDINLRVGGDWNYSVALAAGFTATARRNIADAGRQRDWTITAGAATPVCAMTGGGDNKFCRE